MQGVPQLLLLTAKCCQSTWLWMRLQQLHTNTSSIAARLLHGNFTTVLVGIYAL